MQNRQTADLPAIMASNTKEINSLSSKPYDFNLRDIKYLHFHREFELGFCISGEGTLFHNGKEYAFSAKDAQIVFPYMRHLHKTHGEEPCNWAWIYINCETLFEAMGITNFSAVNELIRKSSSLSGMIKEKEMPELYKALTAFIKKHTSEGFESYLHMAHEFYGILLQASDSLNEEPMPVSISAKINTIEPALKRINEDIKSGESTSVEELSKLCGISLTGFRRTFTNLLGASPKTYIQACRIRRAKDLLREGKMSILDIGFAVGYNDISVFNRAFLNITGETPSEYRKRH